MTKPTPTSNVVPIKAVAMAAATPGHNVSSLARELGLSRQTVRRRLESGWDPSNGITKENQSVATPMAMAAATHGHGRGHPLATPSRPPRRGHGRAQARVAMATGHSPATAHAQGWAMGYAHAHPPVDLVQLRRDIEDWTKLHDKVEELRKPKREPYNPRMIFFVISAAFYVFLAVASVS